MHINTLKQQQECVTCSETCPDFPDLHLKCVYAPPSATSVTFKLILSVGIPLQKTAVNQCKSAVLPAPGARELDMAGAWSWAAGESCRVFQELLTGHSESQPADQ